MKLTQVPALPALLPRRPYAGKHGYIETLSDNDLRDMLTDPKNLIAAIALWNAKSGYSGVLTNGSAHMGTNGIYNYKHGKSIIDHSMRTGVIRMSNSTKEEIRNLTTKMVKGETSENDWYEKVLLILLLLLMASWLVGIGGPAHYDASAEEMFIRMFAPQYRWLDNFASEINSGAAVLNGSLINRSTQYGRTAYVMYQRATLEAARREGYREGRRVLGENENHCYDAPDTDGCIELAALGWMSIESLTPIGQATCRQNCLCHYEFRRSLL